MSNDRWMDTEDVGYVHNGMQLSLPKNEVTSSATTWTDLEIITLSEVSQTEKDKYMISLIRGI